MFENILGNEKNKQILQNLIKTGNIAHSYMFIGQERNWEIYFCKRLCKSDSLPRRKQAM